MKIDNLKRRLRKDRRMMTVSLTIPEDVIEDLERVAPHRGFSGHEPLMRAYIGQGLRADLERLESNPELTTFVKSLRRLGVTDEVIASAMADVENSAEAA